MASLCEASQISDQSKCSLRRTNVTNAVLWLLTQAPAGSQFSRMLRSFFALFMCAVLQDLSQNLPQTCHMENVAACALWGRCLAGFLDHWL